MDDRAWDTVDRWFERSLLPADDSLDRVLAASSEAGLPSINVSPTQGRLLSLLVRISGATSVLEVGTLGGYSTIWLARALPVGGRVVTLEIDGHHAEVAGANLVLAGVDDRVEVRVGPALDSLELLSAQGAGPFDLVFIDADKPSNAAYFEWAMRLTRPGAVIVVDNVVRGGAVADPTVTDPAALGVRRLVEVMAAERRIDATAVQTVGSKGYDGFIVGVVVDPPGR